MPTLTKNLLTEALCNTGKYSNPEARQLVNALVRVMQHGLAREGRLCISGFGCFEVRQKGERKGRNPATGESLVLDARKIVAFTLSKKFRKELNELMT